MTKLSVWSVIGVRRKYDKRRIHPKRNRETSERPRFSGVLQEKVAPDINGVAEAIARKNNWKIAPDGNTALNLLDLSTQVPANWNYITSDPNNSYQIGNIAITFSHRADKILSDMSYKTIPVIQSLNALGKENITDNIIGQLAKKDVP